jgi:hypothetical protein
MYIQRSVILTHTLQLHIYVAWFLFTLSQFPFAPLAVSLLLPFVPFSTYLAPSSCDRNCPPPSQVACKLTLFAPPFTQLSHPFQLPRTPTTQRLTTTTLGLLRSYYAEHSLPNVGGGGAGWSLSPRSPIAALPPRVSGLQGWPREPCFTFPPPAAFPPPP